VALQALGALWSQGRPAVTSVPWGVSYWIDDGSVVWSASRDLAVGGRWRWRTLWAWAWARAGVGMLDVRSVLLDAHTAVSRCNGEMTGRQVQSRVAQERVGPAMKRVSLVRN
jgi:hypothetical protein